MHQLFLIVIVLAALFAPLSGSVCPSNHGGSPTCSFAGSELTMMNGAWIFNNYTYNEQTNSCGWIWDCPGDPGNACSLGIDHDTNQWSFNLIMLSTGDSSNPAISDAGGVLSGTSGPLKGYEGSPGEMNFGEATFGGNCGSGGSGGAPLPDIPGSDCGPIDCPPASPVAGAGSSAAGAATTPGNSGSGSVNPATGSVNVVEQGIIGAGFGGWGHRLVWSNQTVGVDATLTPKWTVEEFPSLRAESGVTVVKGAGSKAFAFDAAGKSTRHNSERIVTLPSGDRRFEDTKGNVSIFYGTETTVDIAIRGKLKQFIAAGGDATAIQYVGANPVRVERVDAGAGITQAWVYAYIVGGVNDGMIQSVRFEIVNGAATSVVREIVYDYYTGTGGADEGGGAGQVARATVKDAAGATLDRTLYRYYRVGLTQIRSVVRGRQYDRLAATVDPMACSDAQAEAFADLYFEYDASNRVSAKRELGAGCTCSGSTGQGMFKYSYVTSTHPADSNTWRTMTTELLPDGTDAIDTDNDRTITFSNAGGQPVLEVRREQSTAKEWITAYRYDAVGRLLWTVHPSAMTGYTETIADLMGPHEGAFRFVADAVGLIETLEYGSATTATTTTAGDVIGYVKRRGVRNGELSTLVPIEDITYIAHTDGTGATIYLPAQTTTYRNSNGTGARVTAYTYTWQGSSNRPLSRTVTYPMVPTSQNGYGVSVSETEVYDLFGNVRWRRDGGGYLHYSERDLATGSVSKSITAVATLSSSDFTGLPEGWEFTSLDAPPLHLLTEYRLDLLGRTTRRIDPDGTASYTVYRDAQFEVRSYPAWNPATNRPTGPTIVSRDDRLGSYRERLTMDAAPAIAGGEPTGTEAISGLWSVEREHLDNGGRVVNRDTYIDLAGLSYTTAASLGTLNTHFYRTGYFYDKRGREARVQDAQGTITRLEYDGMDRLVSRWTGTDDTPTSGFWSPTNTAGTNVEKVLEQHYDLDLVGDGMLTSSIAFANASASYSTHHRYDFRHRLTVSRGPDNVAVRRTYDNEGCVTLSETFADANLDFVPAAAELRGKSESECDERGRPWRTAVYEVDPATGTVADKLQTVQWYDRRGNVVKTRSANQLLRKQRYDGAGRQVRSYISVDDAETTYTDAASVSGDKVIEQVATIYDLASRPVATTSFRRHDDDAASTSELAANGALLACAVRWYDRAGRPIGSADYGRDDGATRYLWSTGGALIDSDGDGLPDEAENAPRLPNTSNDWLATAITYDAGGRAYRSTDNLGRVTESRFDAAGRVRATVENRIDGVPTETETDSDRLTEYLFGPGWRLQTLRAHNAKGLGQGVEIQDTRYLYESTLNAGWATSTIYPDSVDATSAGTDHVKCSYDRLGRMTTCTDQRSTVRTIAYDTAGRFLSDVVTTLGTGVDGAIRRIEGAYDSLSRPLTVTSRNAVGATATVVNQVKWTYGAWGTISKFQQNNVGVVATTSPGVTYGFADGATGGLAKHVRPVSLTYPNGRVIHYLYPAAASIGDRLDRLDRIAEDLSGTVVDAKYAFAGAGTVVRVEHPAVTGGLTLDYRVGGADSGFDRFGRIIDQRWRNTAGTTEVDRTLYTYDRASRKITADRVWTGSPTNTDEQFAYDGLDRLARYDRGTLTAGAIADAATTFNQRWREPGGGALLDSLGNWRTWQADADGGANAWVAQTRAHNSANEIDVDNTHGNVAGAAIASGTPASNWFDPTYDAAGNLLTGPKPGAETTSQSYTWDAWNRLRNIPGAGKYQYDGLGRRVQRLISGVTVDFYYDDAWRELESRQGSTIKEQHVWDLRYIDAPVLRWRDTAAAGVLDEKQFYVQDASFNVTAMLSPAGTVVERFRYDPYGKRSIFAANGTTVRATSSYVVNYGFTGRYHDAESGLMYFRTRMHDTGLGRFLNRMPWANDDMSRFRAHASMDQGWAALFDRVLSEAIGNYIQGRMGLYDFMSQDPVNSLEPFSVRVFPRVTPAPPLPRPPFLAPRIGPAPGTAAPQSGLPNTGAFRVPQGLQPNPNRNGPDGSNWGRWEYDPSRSPTPYRWKDYWRYDRAKPGEPGCQGRDHQHWWDPALGRIPRHRPNDDPNFMPPPIPPPPAVPHGAPPPPGIYPLVPSSEPGFFDWLRNLLPEPDPAPMFDRGVMS